MTVTLLTQRTRTVTYVLPVFNESATLPAFHEALLAATAQRPDLAFAFLYVDDGSADDSLDLLLKLRDADGRVGVIALSRNFGHQVAVTAGLDAAVDGADAVIVMDTDLQDPPRVSLELIAAWEDGGDVVHAQRRSRRDSWFKRGTAYVYYWLLSRLTEGRMPRNVGDFKLLDRRVVREVVRYREQGRYLRGIVAQVGFRQRTVPFDRDARHAGETGYPLRRMLRLAWDGILGFSTLPLTLISRLGVLLSLASVAVAAYVAWVRVFEPARAVPGWAFLAIGMFLLSGIELTTLGVIGSYLGRVYDETRARPLYSVALAETGRTATPA